MEIKERIKKGINAYVKNDATAAAIASMIFNKDLTSKDLFNIAEFDSASLGILPVINKSKSEFDGSKVRENIFEYFTKKTNGKILFILCGPSAVGKDTLASYAKHNLYLNGESISYVTKYTTRNRRGFEGKNKSTSYDEPSGKYQYFKTKDDMKDKRKDIALGYDIYDNYYAFSGDNLRSEEEYDSNLLCIYGRFENIHQIREKVLFEYNRIPISILIKAPKEELEGRITRRHSLSDAEIGKRIKDMNEQCKYMSSNSELLNSGFDLVIENSDEIPVICNVGKLTEFLLDSLVITNKRFNPTDCV